MSRGGTKGASFGANSFGWSVMAAFVVAFVGSVTLWWLYFNRVADDSSRIMATSDDPGRLGRTAYTYVHLPMAAGIVISAVVDELTISHAGGQANFAVATVVLGGPALFLADQRSSNGSSLNESRRRASPPSSSWRRSFRSVRC